MTIQQVAEALEKYAPLPLQEGYDNAGLQIGLTASACSGALLCLDVTEDVVLDAHRRGCNLIVSHHPLLFRGVKCIADQGTVERSLRLAIERGIAVYAAHTNLDNVGDGVNAEICRRLGLQHSRVLQPLPDGENGSGRIGELPQDMSAADALRLIKTTFRAGCVMHNAGPQRLIRRIAVCGGSGDFLIGAAIAQGADLFLTGEIGYHQFFGYERQLWLAAIGHYESEQFTPHLLQRIIAAACPALPTAIYQRTTNPIHYL